MSIIKKIFDGKVDALVHHKFVRFGKGEFKRFLIEIKKGKDLKIKSSWDWSNDLFGLVAEYAQEDVELAGKVIANYDFESELPCEASNFSKRGKLYTAEFKTTVSPDVLKQLYEKFKEHFILLKVKGKKVKMSSGKTLPKPGKDPKENFCSATLPLGAKDELAWDVDDFKVLKISHLIHITDIEIPEEFKKDSAKARLEAKRKGTLTRNLDVDGKEEKKEVQFEV